MYRCAKCGCVVDTAEEFEKHLKVSHPPLLSRLARKILNV